MTGTRSGRLRTIEAAATGLAYGAGLCWASASLVASFRPDGLSSPYWSGIPALRTDTCGIAAFVAVAACLCTSEYLRLRRRVGPPPHRQESRSESALLATAAARTATALATGVIIYISVNSVTHPQSLMLQATHLASWPTEGTLRVEALVVCVFSVALLRYLGTRRRIVITSRSSPRLVG